MSGKKCKPVKTRKYWAVNADGAPLMQTVQRKQIVHNEDGERVAKEVLVKQVIEVTANNPTSAVRLVFQSIMRTTQCREFMLKKQLLLEPPQPFERIEGKKRDDVKEHIMNVCRELGMSEEDADALCASYMKALDDPLPKSRDLLTKLRDAKRIDTELSDEDLHRIYTYMMLHKVLTVRVVAVDDVKAESCKGRGISGAIHEYVVGFVLNQRPSIMEIRRTITHESKAQKLMPHTIQQLVKKFNTEDKINKFQAVINDLADCTNMKEQEACLAGHGLPRDANSARQKLYGFKAKSKRYIVINVAKKLCERREDPTVEAMWDVDELVTKEISANFYVFVKDILRKVLSSKIHEMQNW